jgi:hypothetical protein
MIREFGALFGATIVGCGSLYAHGVYQDLHRNLAAVQKDRDSYKRDYEFQTDQRKKNEALVKELQERVKILENNSYTDHVTTVGLGGILALGASGIYALTQMR